MTKLRKLFLTLWISAVVCAIAAIVFGSVYLTRGFSVNLDPLVYYNPQLTTQIFDRNGELIANLFANEHRIYAPFDKIPSRLIEAIVAIEDTSFFEHYGVNPDAILRAAYKALKAGRAVEGASTITQQLVKNILLTPEKSIDRKLIEAIVSVRIERALSKEQILERYINAVFFGHGYYGARTASLGYFRKEIDELSLKEIAILAGIPQSPSAYDPTKNFSAALSRANIVVERMKALGWISDEEYQAAVMEIPKIYDDTRTKNRAPYAVDAIVASLRTSYPDIRSGGYTIYSTIDMQIQQAAEAALQRGYQANVSRIESYYRAEINRYNALLKTRAARDSNRTAEETARLNDEIAAIAKNQAGLMEKITPSVDNNYSNWELNETAAAEKFAQLNGALVTIEPQTGDILALVGGVDYQKSVFNRAFQARRQLGSSFKPFIYLAAFDLGYSPASQIADISRTYRYSAGADEAENVWRPKNYEGNLVGLMTAREAVVRSRNLATINLIDMIGITPIFDKMISYLPKPLPYDMTIALGAHSLSLLEFSEYYTVISNYGERRTIRSVTETVDRFGESRTFETNATAVTKPEQAYLMINVLQDAVRRGTGMRARVADIEIAGKTGTTNDSRDAWFVGITPDTQTIIWFGNDDDSPMGALATGGGFSAPVFADYYKELTRARPERKRRFDKPEGVSEMTLSDKRKEIFTDISKPPREIRENRVNTNEEMLF
ncbi:MAG: PBP1A family penicillin-binding protein [Helicobacteraceae bacterium]|jgi:penicillin-binding protein 1A|nr:PBP1A family penicillin-binding protein [Helicobacteraceae bacterium]